MSTPGRGAEMNFQKCFVRIVIAGLFLSVTAGTFAVNLSADNGGPPPTTTPMRTICVGRFLIDVPQAATFTSPKTIIAGWSIFSTIDQTDMGSGEGLEELLIGVGTSLELDKEFKVNSGHARGAVGRYKDADGNRDLASYGARLRSGNTSFTLYSGPLSVSKQAELVRVATNIRARDDGVEPSEPGLCIEHGFISISTMLGHNESVLFQGRILDKPDVAISLQSNAGIRPGRSLLQRHEGSMKNPKLASHFSVISRGKRRISIHEGEELKAIVRDVNGMEGFSYRWESRGRTDDVTQPRLLIEFDTGMASFDRVARSSLTQEEADVLWDKMLESVRIAGVAN